MYHVLDLVFFHQRHSQGRDDTSLDVQDGCCLTLFRVQFHVVHAVNLNLQRISERCMTLNFSYQCKISEKYQIGGSSFIEIISDSY